MQMNSFMGKQVLALVRDGDFAHAGEEEAILRCFESVQPTAEQWLLNVGCGRGGTAHYLQSRGWGHVVGINVEGDSIAQARQRYPGVTFHVCNVARLANVVEHRFDVLYALNAFYAFPDQAAAFAALRAVAGRGARLVVFDYVDRGDYGRAPILRDGEPFLPHPLQPATIEGTLTAARWSLDEIETVDRDYERWYSDLLQRIDAKRLPITALAGAEAFVAVRGLYADLLDAIRRGALGGAIVRATATVEA